MMILEEYSEHRKGVKMKILFCILIELVILSSCSNPNTINHFTGSTSTLTPELTDPASPTITPTTNPTQTPLPSSTPLPSDTPTPTITFTPTVIPTPEGITELGYYMWKLSKDLGSEISPMTKKELNKDDMYITWLYKDIDAERLYISSSFSGGNPANDQTDKFLLISVYQRYGLNYSEWMQMGLGFSIYTGRIMEKCQGYIIGSEGRSESVDWCILENNDYISDFDLFFTPNYITKILQMSLYPYNAYPITQAQEKILRTKYMIEDYPHQHIVFGENILDKDDQ